MPHEDGPAYHPLVATVSLGAPIILDIYDKESKGQHGEESKCEMDLDPSGKRDRTPRFRILQEPRSLLVTRGQMYTEFLHGIAEKVMDEDLGPSTVCNWELLGERDTFWGGFYERSTRTSLTFRDVMKVAKMGNSLKFLGGSK